MKIQRQPNRYTCLITSFAMALDVPVNQLITETGHDGSENWWPELPEPEGRRGHHVQELTVCCINRGYAVVLFEAYPTADNAVKMEEQRLTFQMWLSHQLGNASLVPVLQELVDDSDIRALPPLPLNQFIPGKKGVLLLDGHAVAWDGESIYDPGGRIPSTALEDLEILRFYEIIALGVPYPSRIRISKVAGSGK